MDKDRVGYLAGVIDGEGSISLNRQVRNNGATHFRPYVSITNTDTNLLHFSSQSMEEITGYKCPIQLIDQRGNQPVYRVRVQSFSGVIKLIDIVLPFLLAKREQALIVRELSQRKIDGTIQVDEQARLHSKVVALNHYGVSSNS